MIITEVINMSDTKNMNLNELSVATRENLKSLGYGLKKVANPITTCYYSFFEKRTIFRDRNDLRRLLGQSGTGSFFPCRGEKDRGQSAHRTDGCDL